MRTVVLVAAAVAAVWALERYALTSYAVRTQEMARTFRPGDRLLVARFLYRLTGPKRGDVVLFHPNGFGRRVVYADHGASVTGLARLIGLPGEWVQSRNGRVQVCDGPKASRCRTLVEPYASGRTNPFGPILVPRARYFLLADNRAYPEDSRVFGAIPRAQMVGRAFMLWWPPLRLRFF